MEDIKFDLRDTLDLLQRTPSVLSALLLGTSSAWHAGNEGGDTWSAVDVVGHLIQADETWLLRAKLILEHGDSRAFEPFNRVAQFERFRGWPVDELLGRFSDVRKESLESVSSWNLTDDQLGLQGRHPDFGAVTLRQLLAAWSVHDLTHVNQISRAMAKRYTEDVGPWRAYLSVLKPKPA